MYEAVGPLEAVPIRHRALARELTADVAPP
jgi:hypothetical protein